jgi:hypothetical protein
VDTQKVPKEMDKKVHMGFRAKDLSSKNSVIVMENGKARNLSLRLDLKDYSSDGIEWK